MAYVPDCDHDLFVSYAHLDNEGESAWVSTLVRLLATETRQRLGTKDLSIWIDEQLDGNHPLTPEILQAVRRSATLLIVMSPSYVASEWCARERNAFLSLAQDCVATGRIFIVGYRDTDRTAIPREFGDLKGYKFWAQDPAAGGVTRPLGLTDGKEAGYLNGLFNLSDNLARKLKEMRAARTSPTEPGPSRSAEYVFVARSTEDLEPREEELIGYLTQAGLSILPETWYPDDNEHAFEAAMKADVGRSAVFVQLLSKWPGRRTRFAGGRRFPVVQHNIARAAGALILQWRDLADDPASVTDEEHRELLDGARANGFEEFKRSVAEAARRKPRQPRHRPANVAVFVNADRDDLGMARELSELLAREGVECYWPIMGGSPEKVRQDLEENLKACDGLILIYGATEPSWVRDQLRQGRKILSQRERELSALAIYLGPPPQKQELAVALPHLVTLDGRAGITPQTLHQFVARLTQEA
jgi:hypothetical protein